VAVHMIRPLGGFEVCSRLWDRVDVGAWKVFNAFPKPISWEDDCTIDASKGPVEGIMGRNIACGEMVVDCHSTPIDLLAFQQ